jgi:hypothetical protein
MRKTKAEKQMDAAISKAYTLAFNGIPVNMLDIPKIYAGIRTAIEQTLQTGKGETLATALKELKAKYAQGDYQPH